MYQVNPLFQKSFQDIPNSSKRKRKPHLDYDPEEEEKLNWEWYNPPEDSIPVSFCMQTSLHGLKYLGEQKRHIFERIFWLVAFVASLVTSVMLIWGIWSDYRDMPIVTVFNPTEIKLDAIPFPGITICSINGLQKTTFDKQINKVAENKAKEDTNSSESEYSNPLLDLAMALDMYHICGSTVSFTDRFVENSSTLRLFEPLRDSMTGILQEVESMVNPILTLKEVSQPCSRMVLHCVWLEKVIDCNKLFRPVETDFGHCCTFNSIPASLLLPKHFEWYTERNYSNTEEWRNASLDYENLMFTKATRNRSIPYRQRYPGRSAGLSILLDPDLDEYFCTNTDSEGFVIGVNAPLDFPRMKDNGIAIQTNSEVFVGLKPEITMSHDSIRGFSLEKRGCYFGNEYKLPHYSTYTVSNCMDECIGRKTEEKCNCTRYYMPQHWGDILCKPSVYNCTDYVRNDIVENGLSESCSECLPTCTEIDYNNEVTVLKLQENKLKQMFEALPSRSELKSYEARNASIVHIYFSKDSFHPKLRKEVTSLTGLLSNTGGLLGLCMGFSVLSLLEILYYGSLRLCCTCYRNKTLRGRSMETSQINIVSSKEDYFKSHSPKQRWVPEIFNGPSTDYIDVSRKNKKIPYKNI